MGKVQFLQKKTYFAWIWEQFNSFWWSRMWLNLGLIQKETFHLKVEFGSNSNVFGESHVYKSENIIDP